LALADTKEVVEGASTERVAVVWDTEVVIRPPVELMQSVGEVELDEIEYVPGAQLTHLDAPDGEYCPGIHRLQTEDPIEDAKVPPLQFVHTVAARLVEYVPFGHFR